MIKTGEGQLGFAVEVAVEVMRYPRVNSIGGPNNLPRTPPAKKSEAFFRMKDIVLAVIPEGHT